MKKRIKDKIFPKNSKVRYYLKLIKQTIFFFKNNGLKQTIKKIKAYDNKKHLTNAEAYKDWIKENEPNSEELEKQRSTKFNRMPKISIVVPVYNTKIRYLKEIIECMKKQTYSNWELCLADASDIKDKEIGHFVKTDKRIKYKKLDNNLGIAKNTNEAIAMSSGEYVGFLDHDDLISIFALYEVVKKINDNPNVDYIYSDEDKIDESSKERFDPHFKPNFAIDTLRSLNYICHFSVIKKLTLEKLGGVKEGIDGAQDYDLILRTSEITKNIEHIHKILYHWRVCKGSTSILVNSEDKPYAYQAGKRVIEQHLERTKIDGIVKYSNNLGIYNINYKVIGNPKITILIPNKDHVKDLENCINSILKLTTYKNYEIIVIENNSTSKVTFEYYNKISKIEKIKVLYYPNQEFNYSKIINYGVKNTDSEYVLQLNNDTELITPNWLDQFLGFAQRQDVGIVGAKLYYPDNTIQHAGVIVGINGTAGHILKNLPRKKKAYFSRESYVQNFSAVTGACLFAKRKIYNEVGYMDENLKIAFNDIDFCLKAREKGYLIVWTPHIELKHFESKSRGYENSNEKQQRFSMEKSLFEKKWADILANGDPYFNKNFRLDLEDYIIKN